MLALATLLVTVLTWSCGLRDMMFMLVLALVASAYGYRVRSVALFGMYGVGCTVRCLPGRAGGGRPLRCAVGHRLLVVEYGEGGVDA